MTMGVKYAIDTARFDTEATAWINGTFEFTYHFWYTGYIAILTISKLLFHSIYPSILFQYAFSFCSTLLFHQGLSKIIKNTRAAFIATLAVILYIPIQQWNRCLLTESIFISLVLLFIWACSIENKKSKWLSLFIIAIAAASVRPNGGTLLITCLVIYYIHFINSIQKKNIYIIVGVCIGTLLYLLNACTDTFYSFLLNSFNKGEVICEYPGWTVTIHTLHENNHSTGSIIKTFLLFYDHPVESIQLAVYRLIALWTDLRAYYSYIHNVFIGIFLLIGYSMAVIGFIQSKKIYRELFLITIIYTGLNSLLVMITYADWDGRFLSPLLPIVFIWSGLGIDYSIRFLNRRKIEA